MSRRSAIVVALLVIAASALYSLVSGASYLEAVLPGGLPLGNALTAFGLCAAAGVAVLLSKRGTVLRPASLASLTAAALWLPTSIALAGNLALNFGGERGLVWLVLSLVVFGAILGVLLWAAGAALLAARR